MLICGAVLAVAKASIAPITTDEAWSFNGWVLHGPSFILSDYSHVNNHVLHTLLVWLSTSAAGESELVLRLPALAGFALVLACVIVLARLFISSAPLRFLLCAGVSLHPYAIDFAACSRGYSLAAGFTLLALVLPLRELSRRQGPVATVDRALGIALVLASLSMGLAMAVVPVAATACVAMCIALAIFFSKFGWRVAVRSTALLGAPAALVVILFYRRLVAQGSMEEKLWFGADSVRASLGSLHRLLAYVTEARVDGFGTPVIAWPVESWHRGLLPDGIHQAVAHPWWVWVLALVIAVTALAPWLRRKPRARAAVVSNALLVAMAIHLCAHFALGLRLPEGRTWLIVLPLLCIAAIVAIDGALTDCGARARRIASAFVLVAGAAFQTVALDGVSFAAHRDWPDNAVVRDAIETVRDTPRLGDGKRSAGFPWYQESCWLYYKRRLAFEELIVAPFQQAEAPIWTYHVTNSRMRLDDVNGLLAGTRIVKSYSEFQCDLRVRDRAGSRALRDPRTN
ncbi:MAG: hypothetical protein ACKVU1_06155 [bacterium]